MLVIIFGGFRLGVVTGADKQQSWHRLPPHFWASRRPQMSPSSGKLALAVLMDVAFSS